MNGVDNAGTGGAGGGGGGATGGNTPGGVGGVAGQNGTAAAPGGGDGGNGGSALFGGSGGGGGGGSGILLTTGGPLDVTATFSGGVGGTSPLGPTNAGGAGGGSGGYGIAATGSTTGVTATLGAMGEIRGGRGGNGGQGDSASGGGGGDGGVGVYLRAAGSSLDIVSGTIAGGNGGSGGRTNFENAGNGGAGGAGVVGAGLIITNAGAIGGGTGGPGGAAVSLNAVAGQVGRGGVGISGSDLAITNSGTITGGMSGDGATQADAVDFIGGTNSLTLSAAKGGTTTKGTLSGNIGVGGSLTIDPGPAGSVTLSNQITDYTSPSGSVTAGQILINSVQGSAVLSLAGANSFTGGLVIDKGVASLDHVTGTTIDAAGAASNVIAFNGGSLRSGVTGTLNYQIRMDSAGTHTISEATGQTLTLASPIAFGGDIHLGTADDTGTIVFTGASGAPGTALFAGTTIAVDGGTAQVGNNNTQFATAVALAVATSVNNDATLNLAGFGLEIANLQGTSTTATIATGAAGGNTLKIDEGSFAGAITGAGSLLKQASGAADGGTLTLTGTSNYTGGTDLQVGTIAVGANQALGTGTLLFDGGAGTLQAAANTLNIGNTAHINVGGTIDANGNAFEYSGAIGDGAKAGSLTVTDSRADGGIVTLTGANTYSGGTTIAAGTLRIGDGGTTGSINGTSGIVDNATLVFDRSDSIAYSQNISGTGVVVQAGTGELTLSGQLTNAGVSVTAGRVVVSGTLTAPGISGPNGTAVAALVDHGGTALTVSGTVTATSSGGPEDGVQLNGGSLSVTATGMVNATTSAVFVASGSSTISNQGTLSGAYGVFALAVPGLTITGPGSITGTAAAGIQVSARGGDLVLGTAAAPLGAVTGATDGLIAQTESGAISIVSDGNVDGGTGQAIKARVREGTTQQVMIVTSAGTTLTNGGDGSGIYAENDAATGAVTITNAAGIVQASGSTGKAGIEVDVEGNGNAVVGTTGAISGSAAGGAFAYGIEAYNFDAAGDITITTSGAGTIGSGVVPTVSGIFSELSGSGTTLITADAAVSGTNYGIQAITTGTGSLSAGGAGAVTGDVGLYVHQQGTAAATNAGVTVTGTGSVTALTGIGIDAAVESPNNAGTVSVTRTGAITAATTGVSATTAGTGSVTVVAGAITTTAGDGIDATATSGPVSVTAEGAIQAGGAGSVGIRLRGTATSNSVTVQAGASVAGAIGLEVVGGGTTVLMNNGMIASSGTAGNAVQVDAGTLVLGEGNGTFSGAIALVDASTTLSINRSSALTLASPITGAGMVIQTSASTTTLTAANTYTGGTHVEAGTLALGNASAAGTGAVSLDRGTTLAFTNSFTFANTIVFTQAGDPAIDTGANTDTLSGVISGPGDLDKLGSGTLILAGTNTYTGGTIVSAGTLLVAGSAAASTVTVANGATLGGSGPIGGLVAQSGGTVAPGAATPYSTLNVAGNVTFNAGSTFAVEITPGGLTDRIAATGTATINGGTVAVNGGTGIYSTSAVYPILTAAGGRAGTFSNLTTTTNLAFLTPTLTYTGNAVDLTLTRKTVTPVDPVNPVTPVIPPPPPVVTFPSVAVTANQRASAGAIEALGTGALYDAVLSQTAAGARAAFNATSGEIHASAVTAGIEDTRLVRDAIFDRLDDAAREGGAALGAVTPFGALAPLPAGAQGYAPVHKGYDMPAVAVAVPPRPAYTVWGAGFGDFGRNGGNGNAAALDRSTGGFVLGADTRVDWQGFANWHIGVAGGYTSDDLKVAARGSSGTFESYFGGLYAGAQYGAVDVKLGVLGGGTSTDTHRSIVFPGFVDLTRSNYGGSIVQGFGELGYKIGLANGFIEPLVQGAAIHLSQDGFRERGGAAALVGTSRDTDVETTTLGVRAEAALPFGGLPLIARAFVGWRHAFGDVDPRALLAFATGGPTFTVAGAPIDRDAVVAQVGLDYRASQNLTLGISYDGQAGNRANDNAVKGRMEYRF